MYAQVFRVCGTFVLCVISTHTCTGHADAATTRISFSDALQEHSIDIAGKFGAIKKLGEHVGSVKTMEDIELPISVRVFELLLLLCKTIPDDTPDLDKDTFFEVLRAANYLDIIDSTARNLFFRNIAAKGMLGSSAHDIFPAQGIGEHTFFEQNENFVCGNTYLGLLYGLANAFNFEVLISGSTATICPLDFFTESYGRPDPLSTASIIRTVRILPSACALIRCRRGWNALRTLFKHLWVSKLVLCDCNLSSEEIGGILDLRLEELDLSYCYLPQGSLIPLGDDNYALRDTINALHISYNELGMQEMAAIGCLALSDLKIAHCRLIRQGLETLARNNRAVGSTLRILDVSYTRPTSRDIVAIGTLDLVALYIHDCGLGSGNLAALVAQGTSIEHTLKKLDASWNDLGSLDMRALTKMGLTVLEICNCYLPVDALLSFANDACVLKHTLLSLDISNNPFGASYVSVLSKFFLEELDVSSCNLVPGSVESFVLDSCTLKHTLRRLNISSNNLGRGDVRAIGSLGLVRLSFRACNLVPGSLCSWKDPGCIVKGTLQTLDVAGNRFGVEDAEALAGLTIRELDLSRCDFPPGFFAPLIDHASSVKNTLWKLNILPWPALSDEDRKTLSVMRSLHIVS